MAETRQPTSSAMRTGSVAVCAALYVAAFVMTHLPPSRVPGGGWINDKVMHLAGYTGLGLATLWALAMLSRRIVGGGVFFGAWLGMLGYALFDEVTQPMVGRSFEWGDLAADAAGAMVGLSLALLLVRRRSIR
ncbi:MAG: VanZ family protein [Phycisphaerales bacterium]|nr:VanZ family protein [Phycisphaerales bacterium]